MPTPPTNRRRRRAGTSLVELLVTTMIFGVVMTSAFSFLLVQTRSYRTMATRTDQVQNARFGHDILRQELRAAGTNVVDAQPLIVYADDSVFAFNADLLTNLVDSGLFTGAIYVDPYASDAEASAATTSSPFVIPNSSFAYPLADYSSVLGTVGEAETVTFYFTADTTTSESDDFLLMRKVNAEPSEIVASGLTRAGSAPFFRFWYDPARYDPAADGLELIPGSWLPLAKTVATRGAAPDTGTSTTTRIDQIRAVEVVYEAARKAGGDREEIRYTIAVPNVGADRAVRACGRPPLPPNAPAAVYNADSARSARPTGARRWPPSARRPRRCPTPTRTAASRRAPAISISTSSRCRTAPRTCPRSRALPRSRSHDARTCIRSPHGDCAAASRLRPAVGHPRLGRRHHARARARHDGDVESPHPGCLREGDDRG